MSDLVPGRIGGNEVGEIAVRILQLLVEPVLTAEGKRVPMSLINDKGTIDVTRNTHDIIGSSFIVW